MTDDLLRVSALEQAELLRRREISSVELTSIYLDRIERHLDLQAFVTVMRKRALKHARKADDKLARGEGSRAPFLGVPSAIKDLVPMRSAPTKLGSKAYRHLWLPFNGTVARRLEKAGLITLGKTSTSEFGVLPVTEPDIHPPARNPWNQDHTPGGSSGGSGAAVAAGLVPIAQGSDGGGSVRIPSAFCHLYGFKPSLTTIGNLHGRVNTLGMSVMGPMARTVSDAAAMLDAMRDDHRQTMLEASKRPVGKLKIRWTLECPVGELEPRIGEAVTKTAKLLEELGHDVEQVPVAKAGLDDFLPLWQAQLAAVPVPRFLEGKLQPVTQWLRAAGRSLDFAAVERLQRDLVDDLAATIGDADVFLSATVPVFPPKVGFIEGLGPREAFEAIAPIGAYTAAFNLSWRPAATLPAGVTAEGLPYGVQIGAAAGEDTLLFRLSRQLEEAMPWRERVNDAFVA